MKQITKICLVIGCLMSLLGAGSLRGEELSADQKLEKAHQLIVKRLTRDLKLNQEEAAKMDKALREHRQKRVQLKKEVESSQNALREARQKGDKEKMKKELKVLRQKTARLERSQEELLDEVKSFLVGERVADFLLSMDDLSHQVNEAREIRRVRARERYQAK